MSELAAFALVERLRSTCGAVASVKREGDTSTGAPPIPGWRMANESWLLDTQRRSAVDLRISIDCGTAKLKSKLS